MDMQSAYRDLYRDIVRDHGRAPHCVGELASATTQGEAHNAVCGDRVRVTLHLDGNGRIRELRHATEGCLLCNASASLMALHVVGLRRAGLRAMHMRLTALITGNPAGLLLDDGVLPGDLGALAGVAAFPSRRPCVMVPWEALDGALCEAGGAVLQDLLRDQH